MQRTKVVMTYIYETSNPERFQQFCQSLLLTDYPRLQCFPVGQPDGGRDAWDATSRTILQVKFRRSDEEESADWMIAILQAELEKIHKLVQNGAQHYLIATNARGTAHPGGGRIDKVQQWLDDNLSVPAQCLWRDELDRRFDRAPASLKLKYSEMLTLETGLDVVLAQALGSEYQRQQDALTAFLASQYDADKTVKFKQVSLSNDLLDLFIDIPIRFPRNILELSAGKSTSQNLDEFLNSFIGPEQGLLFEPDELGGGIFIQAMSTSTLGPSNQGRDQKVGAAELLLSSAAQDHLKLLVLEGAPGQGKSTLAQYVCQVHRARYLNKSEMLSRIPDKYQHTAFRIPVKVDLRDLASFLDGRSPFRASNPDVTRTQSLEVFLSELINYHSGGMRFDANDVLALVKNSPVLLFFDGLDEVADIELRQHVVNSVIACLNRFNEFKTDIQVVVSSRPSVFGRAPGFGKFGFLTFALNKIDRRRIDEYTQKWVVARGLEPAEGNDVRKILDEKLEMAHIRDLTRNPMQLTILLSLVHQIGHSLPDQRTDLYRRYIDLFLTREADKSAGVREHRPVLMGFIQHLAWVLQSQAESSRSSGSVSAENLQVMARKYLQERSHPPALADDLFSGGLERIFVLVERIEGLYEFEVQPLREFFCAQYLYETAPVGTYRDAMPRGDRAQRFEAMAANPFWFNVTRFYGGFYASGEIGTLVLSLEEMIKTGDLPIALHARRVGVALLQDWVFSNKKFAQEKLISAIFDGLGLETLVATDRGTSEGVALDKDCGQEAFRDIVLNSLMQTPVDSRSSGYCRTLRRNGGVDLEAEFLAALVDRSGRERTNQLIRMFRSGASGRLRPRAAWELLVDDEPSRDELVWRASEFFENEERLALACPEVVEVLVDGVLDGLDTTQVTAYSPLATFLDLLGVSRYRYDAFWLRRRFSQLDVGDVETKNVPGSVLGFVQRVRAEFLELGDPILDSKRSTSLASSVAEAARTEFGDSWAANSLAIWSAGMSWPRSVAGGAKVELFDTDIPICTRARTARLRRGGERWWSAQRRAASSDLERMFWAGLVLAWTSAGNLQALAGEVNEVVDGLSADRFTALRSTLYAVASRGSVRRDRKKLDLVDLTRFSSRSAVLVAIAFAADVGRLRWDRTQAEAGPYAEWLQEKRQVERLQQFPGWSDETRMVRWLRMKAEFERSGTRLRHRIVAQEQEGRPSLGFAREILRKSMDYPINAVSSSVSVIQGRYRPTALAQTAKAQDWTFD